MLTIVGIVGAAIALAVCLVLAVRPEEDADGSGPGRVLDTRLRGAARRGAEDVVIRDVEDLRRLARAARAITREEFAAAIRNDDPWYLDRTWPDFESNPLAAIVRRTDGQALLDAAKRRLADSDAR